MNRPLVILPADYARAIQSSGRNWGFLDLIKDPGDSTSFVDGFSIARDSAARHTSKLSDDHYLRFGTPVPTAGVWYRVEPALHELGRFVDARADSLSIELLKKHVMNGWQIPPQGGPTPVVTWCEGADGELDFFAWFVFPDNGELRRCDIDVADPDLPRLAPLAGHWPIDVLSGKHVTVFGAGSIGGAAARSLVSYGVGNIALCDYDRIQSHNFARHVSPRSDLGRLKVASVSQLLNDLDPAVSVEELSLDMMFDTDLVRPVVLKSDLILVATDGIDSRRTANFLARWAEKPAVFACVLEDGAYGEVVRLRCPSDGCLECQRRALIDDGKMDPEPGIELGYGAHGTHRPMTAVGGDLHLVGDFAAKVAVATLLESEGLRAQALAGGCAILGLNPKPNRAEPFDIEYSSEVRWSAVPPPFPDCPVCGT